MTKIFKSIFTITSRITAGLSRIERARGFLDTTTLSEAWLREIGCRALILEEHHTTHIKRTRLTLEHGSLTIQDFERLCPDVTQRSLQRDLKDMIEKGVVVEKATSPTDPTKSFVLMESTYGWPMEKDR